MACLCRCDATAQRFSPHYMCFYVFCVCAGASAAYARVLFWYAIYVYVYIYAVCVRPCLIRD